MVVYVQEALDNEERRTEERMKTAGMCPSDGNNGPEAQHRTASGQLELWPSGGQVRGRAPASLSALSGVVGHGRANAKRSAR